MVSGTLSQSLPVPRTKPASVLPMPVANSPNAPAARASIFSVRVMAVMKLAPGREAALSLYYSSDGVNRQCATEVAACPRWEQGQATMMEHTEQRTCRLVTLGCKVNQYETQYVKEMLEANGYVEATDAEPADLCVVNTCTVTHEGDAKSRQLVRRLHQANPDAALVVMGCYATRD